MERMLIYQETLDEVMSTSLGWVRMGLVVYCENDDDLKQLKPIKYEPLFYNVETSIRHNHKAIDVGVFTNQTADMWSLKERVDIPNGNNSLRHYKVRHRATIIAGMAISACIPDSYIIGYDNYLLQKEKFFVPHQDILALLKDSITITDYFELDFKNAFDILWMTYPDDMRGFDNTLKAIFLEELYA